LRAASGVGYVGRVRVSLVWLAVLLVNPSCVPSPSAIVIAPIPPRPDALPLNHYWPYLEYDGTITLAWCEYACRRFLASGATLRGCREVYTSYALQQSLDAVAGVACELK
jgi:hypothetical protein